MSPKPYVEVEFVGVLKKAAGVGKVRLEIGKGLTVTDIVQKLIELRGKNLAETLLDPESGDPRIKSLILVNGREIVSLKGLKTRVKAGDQVVILPISHGG